MVTATRTMEVEFTAKDAGVGRVTQNVKRAVGSIGDQATKTGKQTESGMGKATRATSRFSAGIGKIALGSALGGGLVAAAHGVAGAFGEMFAEAKEAARVGKVTDSIIKSTGGAAKVTGDQVAAYAERLSGLIGVDDEVIQSGQNILLTFKGVRNEGSGLAAIFDRATAAGADLAAAGFGSIEGNAKTLGKALNNPTKGMTALTRAGVTFTDAQQKTIKRMQESGDLLGAQKIILAEIETQVGGTAAASVSAADKARVGWGNFLENLGTMAMPAVNGLLGFFTDTLLPGVQGVFDVLSGKELDGPIFGQPPDSQLVDFLTGVREAAIGVFDTFRTDVMPILQGFWTMLQNNVLPVLAVVFQFLKDNPETVKAFAGALAIMVGVLGAVAAAQWAWNVAMTANPIGIVVVAIAALVAALVYAWHNSETFRKVVTSVFENTRTVVTAAIGAVTATISGIADWLTRAGRTATDFGQGVIKTFVDTQKRVIDTISGLTRGVVDGVQTLRDRAIKFVTDLRDKFVRANIALRDGAVRAVTQTRDRIVGFVQSLRDRAVAYVISLRDRFIAANRLLRDRAVSAIVQLRDRVVAYVTSLRDRAMAFALSLRDRFIASVRALRDRAVEAVQALRERVVSRVIALRDTAVRVAGQVRDRVLSPFRALRDGAAKIFTGIRDTAGKAFDGLLSRVKGPLREVFGWLNRNLISPLNSVTSKFGLTIPSLPKFHSGTSRVGRGRKEVLALLREDEAVLTGPAADRIGRDTIDRANHGEAMGGPSWFDQFTEFISKPARLVQEMAENGVKWAVSQVMRAIPNAPTSGVPMADLAPAVFNTVKSRVLEWAAGKEDDLAADLGSVAGGSIGSGPWVKPVAAGVGTGYLGYPGHYGVDFPAGMGTPVHAVSNAIVTKAASLTTSYGKHLFLRHADGLVTVYAHLSSLLASVGRAVKTGEVIGRVGSTGNSTGPHLHFETRVGGGYPGPNPRSVMAARGVRFDAGGMLPPGLSMVMNGTGGPEPVLTGQQWARMSHGGGETNIYLTIQGAVDKESTARQLVAILDDYYRRRGGVRTTRGTR